MCFYLLATVNSAAVNMGVHVSLQDPAFSSFGYISRIGIAGSYGTSIFSFLRKQTIFELSLSLSNYTGLWSVRCIHQRESTDCNKYWLVLINSVTNNSPHFVRRIAFFKKGCFTTVFDGTT